MSKDKEELSDLVEFRDSIFLNAYDQAVCEYGSWEKYKREQWKASLFYGQEDLLDLTLCLTSSARRFKYPIAALDLAAYTIKKFGLDAVIVNIPTRGMAPNTRTGENDPAQYFSLNIKFGGTSQWRLHLGAHILARCALLSDDPGGYFSQLIKNMTPPHDIIAFAERELNKMIDHQCPYEKDAENYRQENPKALEEAKNFFYKEKEPSQKLKKEIAAEVQIEKDVADAAKDITGGLL